MSAHNREKRRWKKIGLPKTTRRNRLHGEIRNNKGEILSSGEERKIIVERALRAIEVRQEQKQLGGY